MEAYPYTNLQNLNLDWILEVVADFKSKYTDFGQAVTDSLQAIEDAKDESLETLANALAASTTTINNAKMAAIQEMEEEKASILDVMGQTLQTAINAVETAQEAAVADVGAEKDRSLLQIAEAKNAGISNINQAYNAAVQNLQTLINTFPLDDAEIIGQLQIINDILNGTDALSVQWRQGIYAYVEQDQRTELYPSPNTVTSLVQAGCAGRKLHVKANTTGHLITYIYYWTGDWETTTVTSTPINATETTFIFPNNARFFTVLLGTNPNMTTPINLSDVTATADWIIAGFVQPETLKNSSVTIQGADATAIPNGADLNDYTNPGNFATLTTAIAGSVLHKPYTGSIPFRLIVTGFSSASSAKMQIVIAQGRTVNVYKRIYNGTEWRDWAELATEADVNAAIATAGSNAESLISALTDKVISAQDRTITITATNVQDYFTDADNAPLMQVFAISETAQIEHTPPGNNTLQNPDGTSYTNFRAITGYPAGLLYTWQAGVFINQIFIVDMKGTRSMLAWMRSKWQYGVWTDWHAYGDNVAPSASNVIIAAKVIAPYRSTTQPYQYYAEAGTGREENPEYLVGQQRRIFNNFNNAPLNLIFQIDKNCTSELMANNPEPGKSSVLMTIGFSWLSQHGKVQICTGLDTGNTAFSYVRYGYFQAANDYRWTAWAKMTP